MKIEDMHFKLKDSRDAIIRSPRAEDVEGILAYLIKSAGETDFLLRYPEEWEQLTYEKEKGMGMLRFLIPLFSALSLE